MGVYLPGKELNLERFHSTTLAEELDRQLNYLLTVSNSCLISGSDFSMLFSHGQLVSPRNVHPLPKKEQLYFTCQSGGKVL